MGRMKEPEHPKKGHVLGILLTSNTDCKTVLKLNKFWPYYNF